MSVESNESRRLDLKLVRGVTFARTVLWEKEPLVHKAITAITQATPARLTVPAHGMVDGWRGSVHGVAGMRQINAESFPPKDRDLHRATRIDVNTIELDEVSSAEFTAYESGGTLVYFTAASLAGCTADLVVSATPGALSLVTLTDTAGIVLDDTGKTITFTFEADDIAAFTWNSAVYRLRITANDGTVTGLYHGSVTITSE